MSDDTTNEATGEQAGDETPAPRPRSPITADAMLAWLEETAAAVTAGELESDALIELLGELRQAATACANASDWALLAARESGASLRQIAPVFGRGYVRAPAARLEKLHREVLSADQFLELMRRRMVDGD